MGIRRYKPTTAGRRGASVSDFAELTEGAQPEKSLLQPKRVVAKGMANGIVNVDLPGGVQGMSRKWKMLI